MPGININTEEAITLWADGWCWNALGKLKYNCSAQTVKKRCGILRTSERNDLHTKNHRRSPICYKFPAGQAKLF